MNIDRNFVGYVAGHIMGAQLASRTDPFTAGDDHLDRLADLSVRGALAVETAIERAEQRAADEEAAAEAARASESTALVVVEPAAPVTIPDDWRTQDEASRIALARQIASDQTIDAVEVADAVIQGEVERRG